MHSSDFRAVQGLDSAAFAEPFVNECSDRSPPPFEALPSLSPRQIRDALTRCNPWVIVQAPGTDDEFVIGMYSSFQSAKRQLKHFCSHPVDIMFVKADGSLTTEF